MAGSGDEQGRASRRHWSSPFPTSVRGRGERLRMNRDEPTSCPKWFPLFLLGMGFVGALARQVLM